MNNEMLAVVLATVKRHLEHAAPTAYLIEIIENAISSSEGRTPERYELLQIWRNATSAVAEARK